MELLSSREVESNERSEDPTASLNPSLSPEIAWNKITDHIEAEYAHLGGARKRARNIISSLAKCGAFNLEKELIILGKQKFHYNFKCHCSDYDITISVAGESDSRVRECYAPCALNV